MLSCQNLITRWHSGCPHNQQGAEWNLSRFCLVLPQTKSNAATFCRRLCKITSNLLLQLEIGEYCSTWPFYKVGVTSACSKNSYLDDSAPKLWMIPHTNFEMFDNSWTQILENERASSALAKKIT